MERCKGAKVEKWAREKLASGRVGEEEARGSAKVQRWEGEGTGDTLEAVGRCKGAKVEKWAREKLASGRVGEWTGRGIRTRGSWKVQRCKSDYKWTGGRVD